MPQWEKEKEKKYSSRRRLNGKGATQSTNNIPIGLCVSVKKN